METQIPLETIAIAYTKVDAAKLFDVTPKTIERWCARGMLDAAKCGRLTRITGASVARLLGAKPKADR